MGEFLKNGDFVGKGGIGFGKFGGIDFLKFLPWLVYLLMCGRMVLS